MIACLSLAACQMPAATTFFVAPSGDDGADGTTERPFATLQRARDAVRAANHGAADFTVVLRGGTYRLDEPLTLDARDGGGDGFIVTWRAADNETPILSGGVHATADNVAAARQVYVDGARVARPRFPTAGAVPFTDSGGWTARAGYHFATPPPWAGPALVELGWFDTWSHKTCPVARVEPAADGGVDVVMAQPCFHLVSHDGSGRALPPPSYAEARFDAVPDGTDVIAPAREQLLTITGTVDAKVRNLAVVGLTFADTAWRRPTDEGLPDVQAGFVVDVRDPTQLIERDGVVSNVDEELRKPDAAVVVDAGEDVTFERCRFIHLGGAGLSVQHAAARVVVRDNTFADISSSAIPARRCPARGPSPE